MLVAHLEESLIKNLQAFVAFTRKRVGDPHLAEDIVQECLLKALRADRKPVAGENVTAWFYRILRRTIIDLYRRNDVRDRALERFQSELPAEPSAEDERVLCQCVKRLLPNLPESYRDVLKEIDLDGKPPTEVAAALGLTTNNVVVRLHRARRQLRAQLKRCCKVCSEHGCLDCNCDLPERDDGRAVSTEPRGKALDVVRSARRGVARK